MQTRENQPQYQVGTDFLTISVMAFRKKNDIYLSNTLLRGMVRASLGEKLFSLCASYMYLNRPKTLLSCMYWIFFPGIRSRYGTETHCRVSTDIVSSDKTYILY